MTKKKVGYDAGHGVNTPGKRTPDGIREWTLNNKVVLGFEKEMKTYENVELYRYDDRSGKTDVSLTTRTNKANKDNVDIFVSFHHNASDDDWADVSGVETYTQTGVGGEAVKLAKAVHPLLVKAYGLKDRGLKTANFHITRETDMPAILIEGGFMNGRQDIKKLRDDKVLTQAGINIAQGVAKYLGLKKKPESMPEQPKKAETKPKQSSTTYRVRKSKDDDKTQKGAFTVLNNAKNMADKHSGYKVFDQNGKLIYTPAIIHTVKSGESLSKIAAKYKTTVKKLQDANGIKDANKISIGQKITIK